MVVRCLVRNCRYTCFPVVLVLVPCRSVVIWEYGVYLLLMVLVAWEIGLLRMVRVWTMVALLRTLRRCIRVLLKLVI